MHNCYNDFYRQQHYYLVLTAHSSFTTLTVRCAYCRAWGVDPKHLPAQERLQRYYYVFNRSKVQDVPALLQEYTGREPQLCAKMAVVYGHDPRKPLTPAVVRAAAHRSSTTAATTAADADADAGAGGGDGDSRSGSGDSTNSSGSADGDAATAAAVAADELALSVLMTAVLDSATDTTSSSRRRASQSAAAAKHADKTAATAAAKHADKTAATAAAAVTELSQQQQKRPSMTLPWRRSSNSAAASTSADTSLDTAAPATVSDGSDVHASSLQQSQPLHTDNVAVTVLRQQQQQQQQNNDASDSTLSGNSGSASSTVSGGVPLLLATAPAAHRMSVSRSSCGLSTASATAAAGAAAGASAAGGAGAAADDSDAASTDTSSGALQAIIAQTDCLDLQATAATETLKR
jgi:hypothetical protein